MQSSQSQAETSEATNTPSMQQQARDLWNPLSITSSPNPLGPVSWGAGTERDVEPRRSINFGLLPQSAIYVCEPNDSTSHPRTHHLIIDSTLTAQTSTQSMACSSPLSKMQGLASGQHLESSTAAVESPQMRECCELTYDGEKLPKVDPASRKGTHFDLSTKSQVDGVFDDQPSGASLADVTSQNHLARTIHTSCMHRDERLKIGFEALQRHFHEPLTVAATKLHVGTSYLKKVCRQLGIRRWPYRSILAKQSKQSG